MAWAMAQSMAAAQPPSLGKRKASEVTAPAPAPPPKLGRTRSGAIVINEDDEQPVPLSRLMQPPRLSGRTRSGAIAVDDSDVD